MTNFTTGRTGAIRVCAVVVLLGALPVLADRLRAQPNQPAGLPPPPDNYYAAGNHIEIRGPILGDAVLAGRDLEIRQPVDGDVLGAGWRVTLSGAAHDDVRIAGGNVRLEAPIDGDVTVAGGDVTSGPQVRVGGRAWVSGAAVRLEGTFARDVRIAGRHVQLGADITGPVEVVAERVEILSGAHLRGPLTYRSPTAAEIAPGAILDGPVTFKKVQAREVQQARATRGVSSVLFGLHVFLTGLLVIVLIPRFTLDVAATLRQQPGRSLATGFALLVTLPIAAILLMISILGLPLGVAVVALYLVALLIGLVTTAYVVGQLEAGLLKRTPAGTRGSHALLLFAGVVTLAVLRALPVVGGVVVLASVLFGLGALTLWIYRHFESAAGTAT
jgi:cytoskeletal protein CcmA (bactofilin family)